MYRQALAIKRNILAPDDPALATGLNNLGALLAGDKSKSVEAELLLRQALKIRTDIYGLVNSDVALSQYNLAMALKARGENIEALSLLKEAFTTDKQVLGLNDQTTVMVGRSLHALQQKMASANGPE